MRYPNETENIASAVRRLGSDLTGAERMEIPILWTWRFTYYLYYAFVWLVLMATSRLI